MGIEMLDQAIDAFLSRTTLRQIEVMVALQKHGSMSKTAEALDMSVANVSKMTKRFETNLDVRLFDGYVRRLALRDDAHEILDRLTGLKEQIDLLKRELESLSDNRDAQGTENS